MIIGATGLILPMDIQGITLVDYSVMMGSIVLLWLFSYTKFTVERWEGAVLAIGFFAYMAWIVIRA